MGSFVEKKFNSEDEITYSGYDKSLLVKSQLGLFLNNMIFENHDVNIFNILEKSDKLFKYKYDDGELLIDRVVRFYENSLFDDDANLSNYYARIVFDILKCNEYRYNKTMLVISELRHFKSKLNKRESSSNILSLIDRLSIICSELSSVEKESYLKRFERTYGIKSHFSSSIEKIDELKFPNDCKLIDLRSKNIVTMDHKFKVAYDDAISVEKLCNGDYLLNIYITDVASFVGDNTLLYNHARERSESIYGDERNSFYIPMFPRTITKDFFSLRNGEDKYVVVYSFLFSPCYDLKSCEFYNALINVRKNYSFDQINRMNKNDSNYDMVYLLSKITDSLKRNFNSDYHLMKEKNRKDKKKYDNGVGSNIISNATIFLNTFIAEKFKSMNFPYIYRVNTSSVSPNFMGDTDLKKIIKGSSISSYSVEPLGHPVNNGMAYGHITNPMRNFASYMNQYIFKNTFLDFNNNNDIIRVVEFNKSIAEKLPVIVSEINDRLYKNEEFLDVLSELSKVCPSFKGKNLNKRLTKKR